MTEHYLTEERRMIQDAARQFTLNEVLPVANELDPVKGDIPMELRQKMADMGYFGIRMPEEHGGLGLGVFEYALIAEELARDAGSLPRQMIEILRARATVDLASGRPGEAQAEEPTSIVVAGGENDLITKNLTENNMTGGIAIEAQDRFRRDAPHHGELVRRQGGAKRGDRMGQAGAGHGACWPFHPQIQKAP